MNLIAMHKIVHSLNIEFLHHHNERCSVYHELLRRRRYVPVIGFECENYDAIFEKIDFFFEINFQRFIRADVVH